MASGGKAEIEDGGDGWDDNSGSEEYMDAVTRHAKYLGIDPEKDATYMWIAEEVRLQHAPLAQTANT